MRGKKKTDCVGELKSFLSPKELANILCVGTDLVYKMMKSGEINHCKFGGVYRVSRDEVYRLLGGKPCRLLSVSEFAQRIHLSPETIYAYISAGKISAIKFGGVWRIREDILDRMSGG